MEFINVGDKVRVIELSKEDLNLGFDGRKVYTVMGNDSASPIIYFKEIGYGISPRQVRKVREEEVPYGRVFDETTVASGEANVEEPITHDEMLEELDLDDKEYGEEGYEAVDSPNHYAILGEYEVIDYIKDRLTPEQYEGYCMGNVIKYTARYQHKNGTEDLSKALKHLDWAIDERESRNA